MKSRFYICRHCGNLVGMINNSGVPIVCCGEKMQVLEANTKDASLEKHVPVVKMENGILEVSVGSVEHPMQEEHFIQWIYVETENGGMRKSLKPSEKPAASFKIDDKPIAVYEYCNIHGLWATKL